MPDRRYIEPMNRREILRALELLEKQEIELDVHERLILSSYKKMANDEQKELLSHALERAQHYNNAILAGGYATFFAAWSFFQEYRNEWYDLSMLLMLFSVTVFVFWTIFANTIMSNDLFKKISVIDRHAHDPISLFNELRQFDTGMRARAMRRQKWWWVALALSVVPGAVAALVFFYIIGTGILEELPPFRPQSVEATPSSKQRKGATSRPPRCRRGWIVPPRRRAVGTGAAQEEGHPERDLPGFTCLRDEQVASS
jgi:hypothetical protein